MEKSELRAWVHSTNENSFGRDVVNLLFEIIVQVKVRVHLDLKTIMRLLIDMIGTLRPHPCMQHTTPFLRIHLAPTVAVAEDIHGSGEGYI